jgi:hypothetical protein
MPETFVALAHNGIKETINAIVKTQSAPRGMHPHCQPRRPDATRAAAAENRVPPESGSQLSHLPETIEASRAKLKDMMESRLGKARLCALMIDATPFEGQQRVVALGIGQDGRKTILGTRQGANTLETVFKLLPGLNISFVEFAREFDRILGSRNVRKLDLTIWRSVPVATAPTHIRAQSAAAAPSFLTKWRNEVPPIGGEPACRSREARRTVTISQ